MKRTLVQETLFSSLHLFLSMPIKRSFIGNSFGHPHQPPKEQLVVTMFEKPLTPSDVGKLNRLVIPKQHAEKHFPVARSGTGDSALLLSFEDEEASGRWWRFRYSYWSSSQSYVLTKGWRSYVKEKGLGAGDVIAFGSHRADSDHWFIGWRRGQPSNVGISPRGMAARAEHSLFSGGLAAVNVVIRGGRPISSAPRRLCQPFVDDATRGNKHDTAVGSVDIIQNNQTTQEARNPRRLRLFGVNLECQVDQDTEPSTMGTPPSSSLRETDRKLHSNQTFYPSGFPSYGNAMMHQLI